MQAGALTSMTYQRVSSLRTKETVQPILAENSDVRQVALNCTLKPQATQDQVRKISQSSPTLKDQSMLDTVPQVPRNYSFLKSQVVQKQMQQVPMSSSTVVAQVTEKRLQQGSRDSSTLKAVDAQDQMQQEAVNSGENGLSLEQGLLNQNRKRGITVMRDEKYDIPDIAQEWALKVIQDARRKYKNDLYMNHYKTYYTDDLRMANKPKEVSESDFKDLLKYWNFEEFKKMSETNTKNRKKWKNAHTAGKTSFAVIRNNLEKEKETPDELSRKEMFMVTRSRKPGRVYKESNEDTISKIAEMEKVQSQQSEDDNQSIDAFATVMGSEHPGCMRIYGRGVTKTTLQRKGQYESYLSANDEKMQKQMEELEERMHQRMAEKLEQQKTTIHKEVTNDILG